MSTSTTTRNTTKPASNIRPPLSEVTSTAILPSDSSTTGAVGGAFDPTAAHKELCAKLEDLRQDMVEMFADRHPAAHPAVVVESESPSILDPVIVLTQEDVNYLSLYLGINIISSTDLLRQVFRASTMNLEGVEVKLEPAILTRLKSRCFDANFPRYVQELVKKWATEYVNL